MKKESFAGVWIAIAGFVFFVFVFLISVLAVGVDLGSKTFNVWFKSEELKSKFVYYRDRTFYASGEFCEVNDDSRVKNGKIEYESLSGDFTFELPEDMRMAKEFDAWKTDPEISGVIGGNGFNSLEGESYTFIPLGYFENIDCYNYRFESLPRGSFEYPNEYAYLSFYKNKGLNEVADSHFEYSDYSLDKIDEIAGYSIFVAVAVEGKGGPNYFIETNNGVITFFDTQEVVGEGITDRMRKIIKSIKLK